MRPRRLWLAAAVIVACLRWLSGEATLMESLFDSGVAYAVGTVLIWLVVCLWRRHVFGLVVTDLPPELAAETALATQFTYPLGRAPAMRLAEGKGAITIGIRAGWRGFGNIHYANVRCVYRNWFGIYVSPRFDNPIKFVKLQRWHQDKWSGSPDVEIAPQLDRDGGIRLRISGAPTWGRHSTLWLELEYEATIPPKQMYFSFWTYVLNDWIRGYGRRDIKVIPVGVSARVVR